jgi:tetratricopeptide (TPR) repeat protein
MILGGTRDSPFVIPRWLAYRDAQGSGELSIPGSKEITFAEDFARDIAEFRRAPSLLVAADLLGLAFLDDRPEAVELAKYLAAMPGLRMPTARVVAKVLGTPSTAPAAAEKDLSVTISRLKADLRKFPRNAAKWVDLARCYTACGQNGPALRALRVAVGLAPHDRFSNRALCRFFIHAGDYDSAHEIFRRTPQLLKDPWLLAPAASVASMVSKPSPLPRRINTETQSDQEAFHYSELFEAFGTEEFFAGNDRSARKALRAAWRKPSHNVITHAQWITTNALPGLRGEVAINFRQSAEAAAQECTARGDLKAAHQYIELWRQEEPYSTRPYVLESFLHSVTEDFAAVKTVFDSARTRGLVAGMLVNNTVVAHACSGEFDKAMELFRLLKASPSAIPEFTLLATEGLLAFARDDHAAGEKNYKEAEDKAPTEIMKNLVFLNRILELYRFCKPVEARDRRRFDDVAKTADNFHAKQLVQNIRSLAAKTAQPPMGPNAG